LLNSLLANLVATPTAQKDLEADDLIRRALAFISESSLVVAKPMYYYTDKLTEINNGRTPNQEI